jgi:hypothetical protein
MADQRFERGMGPAILNRAQKNTNGEGFDADAGAKGAKTGRIWCFSG